MITTSSTATSYTIALDDEYCVDVHESVTPVIDDIKEHKEITQTEAYITIGTFLFVVFFIIFILPFFDS